MPELFIPPTGFLVVPVLAWWRRPSAVAPVDPGEVAAVEPISVSELADPAVRLMMHRPRGIILPAFRVRGLLIWGMTAAVVDRLLALAGWERPWDSAAVVANCFPPAGAGSAALPPAALGCLPGAGIPGLIGLVTGTTGETL